MVLLLRYMVVNYNDPEEHKAENGTSKRKSTIVQSPKSRGVQHSLKSPNVYASVVIKMDVHASGPSGACGIQTGI